MTNVAELMRLGVPANQAQFLADTYVSKTESGTVVSGVTMTVASGGAITVASGGTLTVAGTHNVTGTNQIGGVTFSTTAAEMTYLDLGALGTGAASKAVVLDAGEDYIWPSGGFLTYGGTQVTATGAEINLLDGSSATVPVVSTAAILDDAGALRTAENVGTAGTNCTAVEYGDGYHHITVLTLTAAELTPTIPADAEGAGAIIYTFPAGVYVGKSCHMDITAGVMDTATNAVDLGIGSVIVTGDVATLTTATWEDWVTGQTVANAGTFVKEKSTVMTAGQPLLFETGGSHVLHVNTAATWNATVGTASVTGTVTFAWEFLGA